jgi:type IV secretory pathway VirB4 component
MLKLERIFKNYSETGSFNEEINLYGFVDSHLFLTKTGDLGAVLEVRGVDYECLDATTIDNLTKRLESALKLFDENYRVYQYVFKRIRLWTPPLKTGLPTSQAKATTCSRSQSTM